MANTPKWNIRLRHEWLATPLKKKRVKRCQNARVGLLEAQARKKAKDKTSLRGLADFTWGLASPSAALGRVAPGSTGSRGSAPAAWSTFPTPRAPAGGSSVLDDGQTLMNHLQKLAGLARAAPPGCRVRCALAPFDQMDRAQITVLRLSQPQPAAAPVPQAGGLPGLPGPARHPAGAAALGQQALQGLQNALPGVIPPGSPGLPARASRPSRSSSRSSRASASWPRCRSWTPASRTSSSTSSGTRATSTTRRSPASRPAWASSCSGPTRPRSTCSSPSRATRPRWTARAGRTRSTASRPDTARHLGRIYENLWGPVPPGA